MLRRTLPRLFNIGPSRARGDVLAKPAKHRELSPQSASDPAHSRASARDLRFGYLPWEFWRTADPAEIEVQLGWQADLASKAEAVFGQQVFVSRLAAVFCHRLELGDRCFIGAFAYLTDDVRAGPHCSMNPFSVVRGKVKLGAGVRIGAHSSILGFDHGFDLDRPVYEQALTSRGITIGDDVWIGSHVVILDGANIGDHVVIGAGSVVTGDVPSYAIVAGNPARFVRDRRHRSAKPVRATAADGDATRLKAVERHELSGLLAQFGARARKEWPSILDRAWDGSAFYNLPGGGATQRAWCDAIEIAACFDSVPTQRTRDRLVERLGSVQDPVTGLFPEDPNRYDRNALQNLDDGGALYNVMAVCYALETLGAKPSHPIHVAHALDASTLVHRLAALDWDKQAWSAGHWVDCVATAFYLNMKHFQLSAPLETLFGWLALNVDRLSGLWGKPTPEQRRLQPVNGFYRLTRGSYAQFGVNVPRPVDAIDSVLAHSRDTGFFRGDCGDACNVLDVVHPLWLCLRESDHRRGEAERWVADQLHRIVTRWQPGEGFSFELETEHPASLQGTEMWLAIMWLAADLIGVSAALGYRPRGVHRPEVALPVAM